MKNNESDIAQQAEALWGDNVGQQLVAQFMLSGVEHEQS